MGYEFSPFWDPPQKELDYCMLLVSWWKAVQWERKAAMGIQVQIGGGPPQTGLYVEKIRRQHRLICDADPEAPPSGFFDCTVEVRA